MKAYTIQFKKQNLLVFISAYLHIFHVYFHPVV